MKVSNLIHELERIRKSIWTVPNRRVSLMTTSITQAIILMRSNPMDDSSMKGVRLLLTPAREWASAQ